MSCAATQAIARVRHEPDLVAVRRLEALLNWQAERRHAMGRAVGQPYGSMAGGSLMFFQIEHIEVDVVPDSR